MDAVREMGAPVDRLMGVPLSGCEKRHVLRYPRQATFHPLRYVAGVAKACQDSGVTFYVDSPVEDVSEQDGAATVTTARGSVCALNAVVATNSSIADRLAIHTKGIEADILADRSIDYPDRILEDFDFVVASVHSRFKMTKKEQTDRVLKAIANSHTTIIGHMRGRQLQRRPGYEIDVDKILKACAKHGVAVEINAHPWRLDLDWRWHQKALDYGCIFSINPDAHSIRELDHMHWGVQMARKGGVPADRVLNAMPLAKLLAHLTSRQRCAVARKVTRGRAPSRMALGR